jgi:hypothetical protein
MALAGLLAFSASDADAGRCGRRGRCCSYTSNSCCYNNYGYNYGYAHGHDPCCGYSGGYNYYNQVGYGGGATGCGCGYGNGQSAQVMQYQGVQRGNQAVPGNQVLSQQQQQQQQPTTNQDRGPDYPTYQTRVAPVNVPVDSAPGADESNDNDDQNDNDRTQDDRDRDNDDDET